jgi:apolipoprotein N-acyltransferase
MKPTDAPNPSLAPAATRSDNPRASRPRFGRDVGVVAASFAATVALFTLTFQPLNWWPLMFVALVPWAVATVRIERAWLVHWASFLTGFAFFCINLKWLYPVTDIGFVALAFYLAVYWPMAAWALRSGKRRGISPIWTLPVIWVACEYLRAFVMSGFPWLFAAHPFAKVLPFIQISDLGGAYAVSFVALMINGALTELLLTLRPNASDRGRPRQLAAGSIAALLVVGGTLGYGYYRLGQTEQFVEGPRVAVVQEDVVLYADLEKNMPAVEVFSRYLRQAAAAAQTEPDLLVFPETVWSGAQNRSFVEGTPPERDQALERTFRSGALLDKITSAVAAGDYEAVNAGLSMLRDAELIPDAAGPPVTLVLGSKSIDLFPESLPSKREFNSALVYDPDGRQRWERYDKIHLVPFGEMVPFRDTQFHWLYLWLNALSPFSYGGQVHYSLTPGEELTVFTLETADGAFRFGVPICYEDVMPYIPRQYVWGDDGERRVDFLVNISNEGWFLRSEEVPQHLAIAVFRAVENRVTLVRAVNAGISGFIDPNGRTYSLVTDDAGRLWGAGVAGFSSDHVLLDDRTTLYGLWGDWLPRLCLILAALLWLEGVVSRWIWAARLRVQAWQWKRKNRHAVESGN